LPYNAKQFLRDKETLFYILFLVIWISGLAGVIITPALDFLFDGMINIARFIFRV